MAGACGTTDLLSTGIRDWDEWLKVETNHEQKSADTLKPKIKLQICCWDLMIVNQELPLHPLGFHEKHNGIEYSGYVDPML